MYHLLVGSRQFCDLFNNTLEQYFEDAAGVISHVWHIQFSGACIKWKETWKRSSCCSWWGPWHPDVVLSQNIQKIIFKIIWFQFVLDVFDFYINERNPADNRGSFVPFTTFWDDCCKNGSDAFGDKFCWCKLFDPNDSTTGLNCSNWELGVLKLLWNNI